MLLGPFQVRYSSGNMIVENSFLYISNVIDPIWEKPKDWFGKREELDDLVRFIKKYISSLPVTVTITRIRKRRENSFKPIVLHGDERNVMFAHNQFRVAVLLEDVIDWIHNYIMANDMYADGNRQYVYLET